MRVPGQSFGTSLRILVHNPSLILAVLSGNFDRVYCSYWAIKLKEASRYYEKYVGSNPQEFRQFMEALKAMNAEILSRSYSRIEAFYIPLYAIIRFARPEVVVETGVHRGVSSLFILQAMIENGRGKLYSIDLPHAQYKSDSGMGTESVLSESKIGICVPENLRSRWTLILGDSRKELPALLAKHDEIDVFLHDSQHTYDHMMWEFQTAWQKMKTGGLLLSDDIHWCNAFSDFAMQVRSDHWELFRDRQSIGTGKFGIVLKQ